VGYSTLKGKPFIMTRERANGIRPILEWIEKEAPRQRERSQATSLLKDIRGISDWKQLMLTRREVEMLSFIFAEFPEGSRLNQQLELFKEEE